MGESMYIMKAVYQQGKSSHNAGSKCMSITPKVKWYTVAKSKIGKCRA